MAPERIRVRLSGSSNQVPKPVSNISSGVPTPTTVNAAAASGHMPNPATDWVAGDGFKAEKPVVTPRRDPSEFAWKHCGSDGPTERLRIKEEAVRRALGRGDQVKHDLQHLLNCVNTKAENDIITPHTGLEVYDSIPDIQNWLQQFEDLKSRHSEFQLLVGFTGALGSGKTSAINSILGYQNLLPSSSEGAETSVPCAVEFNHDKKPTFRAKIFFREKTDISRELDGYFLTLPQRLARENGDFDFEEEAVPGEDEEEDVTPTLEMVKSVFGLDKDELDQETTDSVLSKNPAAVRLLAQESLEIADDDLDAFSVKIRPYMASGKSEHYGREFEAWPLIKETKVFVPSDVLKNGTVLVDLPGLGDNVESRSAVATDYQQKLDILAVVTPVIRARNERTGVNLMSEHQALCMQLDGKYNKNSICVILSKTDQLDDRAFLLQHKSEVDKDLSVLELIKRRELHEAESKRLEDKREELTRDIDEITTKLQAANLRKRKRESLEQAVKEKKAERAEISRQVMKAQARVSLDDGPIFHWCNQRRNTFVQAGILKDFSSRQQKIESKNKELYDGKVSMFPICTTAYWTLKRSRKPDTGFPTLNHTGVPALTHWLRYATAPAREKHLDMILNSFNNLLNLMNAWSCNTKLDLTKTFVESQVLHLPLNKLQKALTPRFNDTRRKIKQLDPLRGKETILGNCKQRCVQVVASWSLKNASRPATQKGNKLAWTTYGACIKRKGRPFQSKGAGRPRIAWIERLCNLFYQGVVNEWNSAINEELPALKNPTLQGIDDVWVIFLNQLMTAVRVAAPQALPLFEENLRYFEQIKEVVRDELTKKFDNIRAQAGRIHRNITKSVQDKMKTAFEEAEQQKGEGKYQRQQAILLNRACLRGANMFQTAVADIDNRLKNSFNSLKKDFDAIMDDAVARIKQHVRMMLDEGFNAEKRGLGLPVSPAVQGWLPGTQHAVRQVLSAWQAEWCIGDCVDLTMEDASYAIPDAYFDAAEDNAMDWSSSASIIDVDAVEN